MEECAARTRPYLVLHRRKPYPKKIAAFASSPSFTSQRRRSLLTFWRRARQRHIQARLTWRSKLNRYLLP